MEFNIGDVFYWDNMAYGKILVKVVYKNKQIVQFKYAYKTTAERWSYSIKNFPKFSSFFKVHPKIGKILYG